MNLKIAFENVHEYFFPRIIAAVNDQYIKAAKIKGDDVPWHSHENSDELFYVVAGNLQMEIANEPARMLAPGDIFVVKRGVCHRVSSSEECHIVLVEARETLHTGNEITSITRSVNDQFY